MSARHDVSSVLVAKDSPTQAEDLRHLLQTAGYAVSIARNGTEALALARQNAPSVIVSDVLLPEMDGWALCRAVKADPTLAETPVILMTALSGLESIVRALQCGADALVRTPYDPEDLMARLRYVEVNRGLRRRERASMGVEVDIAGERHFIGADRRQILDLLISTFDEAVRLEAALAARQEALERSSRFLQGLYQVAAALNRATTEREVAEAALEGALALPGVRSGWIFLRESTGRWRPVAARGLPPALAAPGAMASDCRCQKLLDAGELDRATNVLECERLVRARGDTRGLRHHASIPLWIGARTLGVMNLAGPGPGRFADEDLKILHAVGNQVAVALERARLVERLEADVRRGAAALEAEAAGREQAEETRERLIAILEATSDYVVMGQADGRIVYCNRAARRLLGLGDRDDPSDLRIADIHPEWAARLVMDEAVPAAVRDGVWSGETALRGPDGREIPVLQVLVAHKAPDGRAEFLSTVARDITQHKRTQEALRQSEKLAAMGELLAGVAHELNNPLAVILGQSALLAQAVTDPAQAARAEKIVHAAERCSRIVRNFLALARQSPAERRLVALNDVVREALELLAYQLRVDDVRVTLDLQDDLPVLWADSHQLHQVVVNLVTNAHHALRGVAPPRHLLVATRAHQHRMAVVLEVADSGPGVPPEIRDRIFEPFFTTKPPGQGTGLGLPLCRGIVEAHGGTIGVESRPGGGATFRVELPVQRPAETVAPAAAPPPPAAGISLLVVDDDAEVSDIIAEMLRADGHQVDTAPNGAVALQRLEHGTYDAILTDLRMPELDGPGLYREVARRAPHLLDRFIFLTGDTLSPETREFIERTGVPSLGKPFNLDELRRALDRVGGRR